MKPNHDSLAMRGEMTIRLPRPPLRRMAAEHPMGLFALAATATLLSISIQPRLTQPDVAVAPAAERQQTGTPRESEMPLPVRSAERACIGQSWGQESGECLVAIAKDGGKNISARIRTISGA